MKDKLKLGLFVVLTFLMAVVAIDYNPQVVEDKPNAYEVIKYMNNDLNDDLTSINDFYVLFDNYKLDSKNFVPVISFLNNYNYSIIEIYPYINPMYQAMLTGIDKITYKGNSLQEGIAYIYNTYMKELEKYHLTEEIDKLLVNGVKIRMIKINLSNETLNLFLKKYPGVKYSSTPYGLFR